MDSTGPDAPAVAIRDLVVRYGELVAVDGLTLEAARGEVLAVLGPNGAGKTSTIEVAEGYRRPAGGSVRVLGLDPVADHRRLSTRVGLMLQSGGVPTGIRPEEVLRQHAAFYEAPRDAEELLDAVGLAERRRATWRTLSGGERQRLSLALALVGRPEVVFLDEPTSGVDPSGRRTIRSMVAGLRDEGVCVVLTTHDLEEAERLADRVVIVDRGRVVATGTPAELMRSGGEELRFGAPPGIDLDGLASHLGLPASAVGEEAPGEYRVAAEATPRTVAAVTEWLAQHELPLADLRAGRHRLEDAFLRLTAERPDDDGGADTTETDERARSGRRGRLRRAGSPEGGS